MNGETPSITLLLQAWKGGDETALDRLVPLVYSELKHIAAASLSREPAGQTLQPTALVHEVYLRLANGSDPNINDSTHFRCVASRIMRQILVDRARARHTEKRDGGFRVELEDSTAVVGTREATLVALDDALVNLEQQDPEKVRILELKYFGGLTADEMSKVLGISLHRVNWQIRTAQAWLRRELQFPAPDSASNRA